MKYIGIVGSRRRNSPEDFKLTEEKFLSVYQPNDHIVSGGCPKGADRFAEIISARHKVPIKIHKADWKHLGKSAGFQRNGLIAADAAILIAVVASDRTGGTEDTIRKFCKLGKDHSLYLI